MNRLSDIQKKLIRQHIDETVHFLETAEELTDHVITAIEDRGLLGAEPSDDALFGAINAVVQSDFGSFYNIRMAEHHRSEVYFENYRGEMRQRFLGWFKVPYVWFIMVLFFIAMYFSHSYLTDKQISSLVLILLGIVPTVFLLFYYLFTLGKKPSIKRKGTMNFSYVPLTFANLFAFHIEHFLSLEKGIFTGYTYSFVYSAVLLTFSAIVALNSISMMKEELPILKYQTK